MVKISHLSTKLIKEMKTDQANLALNYCYNIREAIIPYLPLVSDSDLLLLLNIRYPDLLKTLSPENATYLRPLVRLILISYSSLKYAEFYMPKIKSRSLRAVLQICFNPGMIFDLEYISPELQVLADIFNNLTKSSRPNLQCYDCGTTARGVFYNLIKVNRKTGFQLSLYEIQQLQLNYFNQYRTSADSLNHLIRKLDQIRQSAVILVSIKFGEELFGHIFIIEKFFPANGKPIYRMYQSALNSYLLIDYLESVKYLENESLGFSLSEFHSDLKKMINIKTWTRTEELLFVKWFSFYPQDTILDTSTIRFNHGVILYGGEQPSPL